MQWSYDLLGDAEKSLLAKCSVFAGGFDLAGAYAVTDPGDDYAILDLLDALVRKSLLVAHRSMTTAAMAAYGCDQIDQARTELDAVSK